MMIIIRCLKFVYSIDYPFTPISDIVLPWFVLLALSSKTNPRLYFINYETNLTRLLLVLSLSVRNTATFSFLSFTAMGLSGKPLTRTLPSFLSFSRDFFRLLPLPCVTSPDPYHDDEEIDQRFVQRFIDDCTTRSDTWSLRAPPET